MSTFSPHTLQITEPLEERQAENGTILASYCCVTNYHKLSGLKQTNLLSYRSGHQKSKRVLTKLKSCCWQGCVPSGSFRGEFISSCFPDSRNFLHSLSHGHFPPSNPSSHNTKFCFHHHISSDSLLPSSLTYKNSSDCIEFSGINQDNLPVSKSLT